MNAIDTNVLVYLVDADEPIKQSQARELMDRLATDEFDTVLLWQAAVEFLAVFVAGSHAAKSAPFN